MQLANLDGGERVRTRRLTAASLLISAVSLAFASCAATTVTIKLKAKPNAAEPVPPQVVSAPQGTAWWTATLTGTTLKWKLTFAHLSWPATGAHVHMDEFGRTGNVMMPL